MSIFDIALDHQRDRQRAPSAYALSGAELQMAMRLGALKAGFEAETVFAAEIAAAHHASLARDAGRAELVDLDAIGAAFEPEAEETDLIFTD